MVCFKAIAVMVLALVLMAPAAALACNGVDVTLSDNPARDSALTRRTQNGTAYYDSRGHLLMERSAARISPAEAQGIAENYLRTKLNPPPLPMEFRKLESVHGKLVYQFISGPVAGYNGKYHLGPVNFTEDHLVLDVDAATGNIYLANGCGAAPGQLLYTHKPGAPGTKAPDNWLSLVPNNTNFIAKRTGNPITIDGIINPEEWSGTGHKYFYLGDYTAHEPGAPHPKASYYAEVWAQIDGENIYFAVKTDSPYWVGLLFKDDPNLGMLPSYRDAKVIKSDGSVTDRHFITRPDQTFYLELDPLDDILSSGRMQKDFYTYELSFPLRSGDPLDVQFHEGRAYNMLLLVGNTLEHYGIFTLDDAHKNHDHSKNNQAHADVHASTETTLRIGEPETRDIFGATVGPTISGYDSGYDPAKSATHFHYANRNLLLKDFTSRSTVSLGLGALASVASVLGLGLMLWRLRLNGSGKDAPTPPDVNGAAVGIDLFLKYPWMKRVANWKHLRTAFIVPMLGVFAVVVAMGLMDVSDGRRNIATVYTWTLWWSLIIFSLIAFGRLWCMMCPFAAIGDAAQRLVSLNRKLPGWLQNMGLQSLGFIALTLAFTLMAFESRPFVTAVVILGILAAAVVFSIIYERRSFCRHLCPVGSVIGLYSTLSPLALERRSKACCDAHTQKTCAEACPMLEAPQDKDNNVYCNLCMKCLPACPNSNLTLRLKPMGTDLHATRRRPASEALAALLLLGVIMVETLAMTSAWQPLKDYVAGAMGGAPDAVVYLAVFFAVVALPAAIFYGLCQALRLWMGKGEHSVASLIKEFAFVFLPLGISLHLAHNIQHLFIEGPIAVPVTLRALETAGINLGAFINWNPAPILGLKPLFVMQAGIVMAGLFLTLSILYRLLKRLEVPMSQLWKMSATMSVYALVVILTSIYMLGLPMNGRHIH